MKGGAQIIVGIGIGWIEPDGFPKGGHRFLGPSGGLQGKPEIAVGRRAVWIEPDRFAISGDRFLEPSQSLERIAQGI